MKAMRIMKSLARQAGLFVRANWLFLSIATGAYLLVLFALAFSSKSHYTTLMAFTGLLLMGGSLRLYLCRKRLLRPQNLFLALALLIGTWQVFITPPFRVPDEAHHFYRAYGIANGKWINQKKPDNRVGDMMPVSFNLAVNNILQNLHTTGMVDPQVVRNEFERKTEPDVKIFNVFRTISLYSPVPFIPQAVGIAIAERLKLSPIEYMYMGRIFNYFCWVVLVCLAISIIPVFKWVLVLIALMPLSTHLAASLSADAFTLSICWLATAYILRHALTGTRPHNWRLITMLTGFMILIILSKQAYFFIPFVLYFLIPYRKIHPRKGYYALITAGYLLIGIITIVSWTQFISHIYTKPGPQVDPHGQIAYILSQPFDFLDLIWRDLVHKNYNYIYVMVGVLGQLELSLPPHVMNMYFDITLLAAIVGGAQHIRINMPKRIVLGAFLLLSFFGLFAIIYAMGNDYRSQTIWGMQGRYFYPLLLPWLLLLYNRRIRLKLNIRRAYKYGAAFVFFTAIFWITYDILSGLYI
jgi:uncharacterized membrane protein